MLTLLDVHYEGDRARAACVQARAWTDAKPSDEWTVLIEGVQPYQPGRFFERELPCLLAALKDHPLPDLVLVDGYVWLDAAGSPGLGAHLHEALQRRVPVIGLAKTAFKGSEHAIPVLRGASQSPLYVTSVGLDPRAAADAVRSMHGPTRLPTLAVRVDHLARGLP